MPEPILAPEEMKDAIEVRSGLSWRQWALEIVLAAGLFQAALFFPPAAAWLVMFSLVFLLRLRRALTGRRAFYGGLLVGFGIFIPQLFFFYRIFGNLAVLLWLLLAVWIAAFVALAKATETRFGKRWGMAAVPVLWMGLEFIRCEVWPLKFAWLTVGFALPAERFAGAFHWLGVYGVGALFVFAAAWVADTSRSSLKWLLPALLPSVLMSLPHASPSAGTGTTLAVAGVQDEDPMAEDVIHNLDKALQEAPQAQLFVMSEYTYSEAPPPELLKWCREHARHVLVGGKDLIWDKQGDTEFYNTAFMIGPDGTVHHKQAKSVPIQFMNDGQPAKSRQVWDGPLGKIGIAICYDMNYARVTDELIEKGAALLVIPAMDVMLWGERAHRLSAQLAAVRAAEYGVPLFRLASSGYSRIATPDGKIAVELGVPAQGQVIQGEVQLSAKGRRPLDRWLLWPCLVLTGSLAVFLIADSILRDRAKKRAKAVA